MTLTAMKYAKVLWELSMPDEPLCQTQTLLEEESLLRRILDDPTIPVEQKHAVIDRVFPGETNGLMKVLCRDRQIGAFGEILEAYRDLKNRKTGGLSASLFYVTLPDERQKAGLTAFLKEQFQVQHVDLELIRDDSLIGGFVLRADNREWDWSLKNRIAQLTEDLSRR